MAKKPKTNKHTATTAKTLRDWLVAHGYSQADANRLVKSGGSRDQTAKDIAADLKERPKK